LKAPRTTHHAPKKFQIPSSNITVISGTDTGVGKTVLTGLLVLFLRRVGVDAVALKPFCSGSRADARHLRFMQDNALTLDEINPFYFREPLAPLIAARKRGRKISFERVVSFIRSHQKQHVLVEGAGGLLTPLGEGFTILDIARELKAKLIIVAPNKLGVINQAMLALRAAGTARLVLMRQKKPDASARYNCAIIRELAAPASVLDFPFLQIKPAPSRSRL
jgi:dethiobiotin synthetase